MTESDNNNYKTKLAIRIIVGQYKASPRSFALFKALANLALTSKAYNILLDILLVTLSCRCIQGGGCLFARNKLYGYIRTSNISGFTSCADEILQTYHQSVYIHIFTKCLIDIVKNCSYDFLAKYITFLRARGVLIAGCHFFKSVRPSRKFPGFKAMELVKALQIANESGWKDKALLLFEHLVEVYSVLPKGDPWTECALKIREKLSQNCKLNFDGQLGNCLGQVWPIWASTNRYRDGQYSTLLCPKKMELAKLPQEVFSLPIEQQPWFFGDDSPYMLDCAVHGAFVVVFKGAKLTAIVVRRRFPFDKVFLQGRHARFYLSNSGTIPNLHIYQFYVSLVKQDLETMKSIQETHKIDWAEVTNFHSRVRSHLKEDQTNPFLELLQNVTAPRVEIVQYLIDIGVPTLFPWPDTLPVHDGQLPAIEILLATTGTKLHHALIIKLLQKRSFMTLQRMQVLINACRLEPGAAEKLILFVLNDFQQVYKTCRIFSERKLTILWIYKYGQSDSYNYLQTLPKELIRLILDFMNEPPLYYELATMIMKFPPAEMSFGRFPTVDSITKFPYCTKLIMEGDQETPKSRLMYFMLYYMPHHILRRDYQWIRNRISEMQYDQHRMHRFRDFLLKHETDLARYQKWQIINDPNAWDFTQSFKTNNIAALRFFIENNTFRMPSRETFESKMKPPKYNMTYEAALALIDELKKPKQ